MQATAGRKPQFVAARTHNERGYVSQLHIQMQTNAGAGGIDGEHIETDWTTGIELSDR